MADTESDRRAESVADPPPVPLVADPALIIDRAHYNDLLRVRFWHWLKRHNDGQVDDG